MSMIELLDRSMKEVPTKNQITTVEINNLPLDHEPFCICRLLDGKLWYHSSFKYFESAEKVRERFENGIVLEVIT